MAIPLKVLVVEDSEDDALLLMRELKRGGFDVTSERVQDAAGMGAALDRAEWDVVLADYRMPGFTGLDALGIIQKRGLDMPFILVSGTIGEETAVQVMKAGAHDYLLKDNLTRLVPAVERELREAEDRRQRRRAEEKIKESEERFRTIFDHARDGMVLSDPETGRLCNPNRTFCQMLGYRAEEVERLRVDDIHPEDALPHVMDQFRRQLRGEIGVAADLPVKRKDGSVFYADVNSGRIELGGKTYLLGMFRDVTERKRAEEALRQSEERLSSFMDAATDRMYLYDANLNILDINKEVLKDWGLADKKEALGRNVLEFVPELKDTERYPKYLEVIRTGVPYSGEGPDTEVGHEGEYRNVRAFKVGDGLGIILTDVTARKRAEEALRQSEERLSRFMDAAPDLMFLYDANLNILGINKAGMKAWGLSDKKQALGKNVLEFVPALKQTERYQKYFDVMRTGEPYISEGAVVVLGHEGEYCNVRAFKVGDGLGVILTDITERKRAEEILRQREQQLERVTRLESIGRLAGGIAHDFNNILTGIMGYTQLALGMIPPDGQVAQDLTQVKELAERAARLTRQLLAFSRHQPLEPTVLDLNELIRNATKMLKPLIGEDVRLEFIPAEDLGNVLADPGQIEQVLMNLVVNARDAMPGGGRLIIETANVTLDENYVAEHVDVEAGPYVRMAVTDTGCGMDKDTQKRVFEPFFTTKGPAKGTGLGLSSAYGIVKEHGGSIWVYSELGRGTTMKVYLPRVIAGVEAAPPEAKGPETPRGSECILLVEDEDTVRELAQRSLEAVGYTVFAAATPADAEALIIEHGKDVSLLLTDVVMPGENGYELYDRLARYFPRLKVLYMSGYTNSTIMFHDLDASAPAFIMKPFTPDVLARKVRDVLDGTTDSGLGDEG